MSKKRKLVPPALVFFTFCRAVQKNEFSVFAIHARSGPRPAHFWAKGRATIRRAEDDLRILHASSDGTFDKKKCRAVVVKYDGEKMSPSVFESKIMERKVGGWETAIRVREGNGDACIFSKWFEKNTSGSQQKVFQRGFRRFRGFRSDRQVVSGKATDGRHPSDDESDESDEDNEENEENEAKEHSSAHASDYEHPRVFVPWIRTPLHRVHRVHRVRSAR